MIRQPMPRSTAALEQTVRQTSSRQLIRLPHHINDPQFAAALVAAFRNLHGNGRQRRRAGDAEPMARFERTVLVEKFRAMIARGEPIVGGGAGTGLSAKCQEAGGIDLIVIYNSGRYRMAGRGSLAGLLAYGDANQIVVEMAAKCCPSSSTRPCSPASTDVLRPYYGDSPVSFHVFFRIRPRAPSMGRMMDMTMTR